MNFYKKLSIRNKLILIILTANIITLIIAFAIVISSNIKEYKNNMVNNIRLNTKIVAEACQSSLHFVDQKGAKTTLNTFRSIEDVTFCVLYDKEKNVFADYNPNNINVIVGDIKNESSFSFENESLNIIEPVVLNGNTIGYLYVKASTSSLDKKIIKHEMTMLILLVILIATAVFLAWILQRNISNPILHLARLTQKISSSNDYSLRAKKTNEDELGLLYDDFNEMIDKVQERDIALRESEERFKQMSESAFDAVVLINEKGKVYFWNRAAVKIFGFSFNEISQLNFFDLLRLSVGLKSFISEISDFNKKKQGKRIGDIFEVWANNAKQEQFPVEISAASLYIDDSWHIICVIKDITERTNNLEAIRKAKDDAEESDRLKSAFLANMSHEIRTPMNSIIGFADLLKNSKYEEEKFKNYLGIIHNNGRNLLNLIDDILDLSKIEAGQLKIKQSEADVHMILDDLYSYFNHEITRHKYDFRLMLIKGLDEKNLLLKTDPYRLRQIFGNLLENAFKFTHEGFIEFGYQLVDKNRIKFHVKDTGIGIVPEKQKLIFERFGQVDSSLTKNTSGTGLGLNISKRLVELLGGEIWVESESEVGTTFHFTLPLVRFDSKAIEEIQEEELIYKWHGKKIIIAEDELANFLLIRELIVDTKANIIHAKNGVEAVELSAKEKADVVLMDINMPEMDGYEATEIIKKANDKIVIIAQTAYAMSGERERALDAGCDDYITKPINGPQLLETIDKYF